ncbi:MAG: DNRLRE domain-containing protein [Clostridia bacterium]|jgi:hypothetical protein|nr:DNRLRE domain-containing protein [Clostridia bacterium]
MASVTIYCNSKDCFARQSSPSNNYNESYLVVGKTGTSSQVDRSFLLFDLSSIPSNVIITDVKLYLRQINSSYEGVNVLTFSVGRITGSWTETGVTWNNQPAMAAADYTAHSCAAVSGDTWKYWTVTNTIAAAYAGSAYTGIYLKGTVETTNSNGKRFVSSEGSYQPYIVVSYNVPTAPTAPTGLSQSPNAFETALRLSWTKGANGSYNAITGQNVRYQTSDNGSTWSAETSVSVSASATYYDIPSANISGWSRVKYVRFRVGSESAYFSTVYSGYSSSVRKNRAPNAPIGNPTTNKEVYAPGETIGISFTPPSPRDPDTGLSGDIAGYEVKMQDSAGTDYNSGQIMGTNASGAATSVNVATIGWTPGQQWKFLVRAYDSYGVRSNWSAATALIMMGTPLKVLVSGSLKSVAEQQVLVNGVLKQVSDIKVLVDGVLKSLTT